MKKPPPSPLHIKQRKEGEGVFLRNIYILEQFLKIIILIWQKISCVILQNSVGWGGGGPVNKHLWLKVIQRAKLKLIGKLFGWNYKLGKRHGILYIMIPRN